MKTKLLIGLVAAAVSQFAVAQVEINSGATSEQTTNVLFGSNVANFAEGSGLEATQNLSSNAGEIEISGNSTQSTTLFYGSMENNAEKGDAIQNASSNADDVDIGSAGTSVQTTNVAGSRAFNTAAGEDSYAAQSMSSNFGRDIDIDGTSTQTTNVLKNSLVYNRAQGNMAYAAQNLSTNFGDVEIEGTSTQTTTVSWSTASNVAYGYKSAARQSMSTNTSCDVSQQCTAFKSRGGHHGGGYGN